MDEPAQQESGDGLGRVVAAAVGGHADTAQHDHRRKVGVDRCEAAGPLAIADDRGDLAAQVPQLAAQDGPPGFAGPFTAALRDADQRLQAPDLAEHHGDDGRQALGGGRLVPRDRADLRLELGQDRLERLDEQRFFGEKVAIDGGLGHSCGIGDVVHLHGVVGRCREQPHGRIENAPPAVRPGPGGGRSGRAMGQN